MASKRQRLFKGEEANITVEKKLRVKEITKVHAKLVYVVLGVIDSSYVSVQLSYEFWANFLKCRKKENAK